MKDAILRTVLLTCSAISGNRGTTAPEFASAAYIYLNSLLLAGNKFYLLLSTG
jgi:hypothetical protein